MQDIAVYFIVAGALIYLIRNWYLTSRGSGCASGCGGCSKAKPAEPQLVQIELAGSFKRIDNSHLN